MNTHAQTVSPGDGGMITLTDDDVSIEEMSKGDRAVVSADQMQDESFQANGQNFQNN